MVAAEFVSVLEKVCGGLNATEMIGIIFDNETVTRETRNIIFQYKDDKFFNEFKLPSQLMLNFLKIYNETYGKTLDPRKVTSVFKNVISEILL